MPERSSLTLHTAVHGTAAVVTLSGELDLTTASDLDRTLARLRETAPASVVLDMAGVEHLDCAAARVIATAAQAWPGPGPLVIRDPRPIVWRLLQLTGLAAAVHLEKTTPARPAGHGRPPAPPGDQQPDAELGPRQLATLLRTPVADLYRARELDLLPDPGPGGRWPPDDVAEIVRGWPETAAAIHAARELGAARSAELLARVTGLPVTEVHIDELATRGLLTSPRTYQKWPLYRVADLHALAADPVTLDLLTQLTSPGWR